MRRTRVIFGIWTFLVLVFLYLPIALLGIYSFNNSRLNITWQGFTLQWYRDLFADATILRTGWNSLIVASVTTVISTILGTSAAWALHRWRFPMMRVVRTLVALPLVMPDVIMGVSLLVLFAVVCGFGNQVLARLGNENEPLGLGLTTIIIGHVTFCFPFVLIAINARLAGMDPALEEAAMDLGATPLKAFARVIVPYLLPAIISGALMAFTLSMDELIVTYFIAGPGSATLPIKVFGMARIGLSPVLNAISTLFVVATTMLIVGASYVRGIRSSS